MSCAIKNCNIKSKFNPKTGLCISASLALPEEYRAKSVRVSQENSRLLPYAVGVVVIVVMRIASK